MKKKNWILPGFVAALVASCILIIGFTSHGSAQKDKSTCRSQKMSAGPGGKNCATKTNIPASGEMILDNLSRQFLSFTSFGY